MSTTTLLNLRREPSAPKPAGPNPKVLLVDDEPSVLAGLRRLLFGRYQVSVAESGAAGLDLIASDGPFAVVVSDMRMPGMDGADFLARVRTIAPQSTRILLTGQAEMEAAVRAINDGQIFRFLTKPCPQDLFDACMRDAVAQHQLVVAERELLDQTLRGAVGALFECLQLADPAAFARAGRIKSLVLELCKELGVHDTWDIEVAATLSQIGSVTLPPDTAHRLQAGSRLTGEDESMLAAFPRIAEQVIAKIPRLDSVRDIVHRHMTSWRLDQSMPLGAAILRVAHDAEAFESRRAAPQGVYASLAKEPERYHPGVLDAYRRLCTDTAGADAVMMPLADLRPGMVLADDVLAANEQLLVGRGATVTETLLDRLRNYARQVGVVEPIVVAPSPRDEPEPSSGE